MISKTDYKCHLPVKKHPYEIICSADTSIKLYPYLIDFVAGKRNQRIYTPSPFHGRSIVVNESGGLYTVLKGSGLTYFPYNFLFTGELPDNAWGFLSKESALRDFEIASYIHNLGIRTNSMDAVIELIDQEIIVGETKSHPFLLQYQVSCPYRLCDAAFIPKKTLNSYVCKWASVDLRGGNLYHVRAASVLLRNLSILHHFNILHNAISIHNYTFALELLDFELSRTPQHPYSSQSDEEFSVRLYRREFIQTLEIIHYIAFLFRERLCNHSIRELIQKYSLEKYLLDAS